jgi:hypothetical protein
MAQFAAVPPARCAIYYCNVVDDIDVGPILDALVDVGAVSIPDIKTFFPQKDCNIWFIAHGATSADDPSYVLSRDR